MIGWKAAVVLTNSLPKARRISMPTTVTSAIRVCAILCATVGLHHPYGYIGSALVNKLDGAFKDGYCNTKMKAKEVKEAVFYV